VTGIGGARRSEPDWTAAEQQRAASLIRDVPDFPRPGIRFRDIMPMLADGGAFGAVVRALTARCRELVAETSGSGTDGAPVGGAPADLVAGIEARGFLLAAPVAYALGCGVLTVRKPDKLPGPTLEQRYQLEYGTDGLAVQPALAAGSRVVLVDDVLATGGTLAAAGTLLARAGGSVLGAVVLLELVGLGGRSRVDLDVRALLRG